MEDKHEASVLLNLMRASIELSSAQKFVLGVGGRPVSVPLTRNCVQEARNLLDEVLELL